MTAVALGSNAQTVWSYADCVEYARNHNISLQKTRINRHTADIALDEAKGQWQPSIDFATSQGYVNSPWSEGHKNSYNSSYGINAGWTLWDGGSRSATIKRDRINVEIADNSVDDALRSLKTDILAAYLNILYARESIGICEEAAKLSKAQADRALRLMEAGKISRVDQAQLQSQYEQDNYSLINARGTYESRRMELKQLLDIGIDNSFTLADVDWSTEQILAALPSLEESYKLALANDVQLRSLNLEKDASELDVDIAKAGRSPKISLNGGVGTGFSAPGLNFSTSVKQAWNESIGLTLSVPILDNKRTKSAVARARVQQMDADLDIDQRNASLARDVENWFIDTRSSQARYSAAVEQLNSARLTDELTNEKFTLGYVDPIELMTSHKAYIEARHTLLQAKFMAILGQKMIEYYRTAEISL